MKRLFVILTTSLALVLSSSANAFAGKAVPTSGTATCSLDGSGNASTPVLTFSQEWSGIRTSSINAVTIVVQPAVSVSPQTSVYAGITKDTSSTTRGWYATSSTSGKAIITSQQFSAGYPYVLSGTEYKMFLHIAYSRTYFATTVCYATAS